MIENSCSFYCNCC